MQNAQILKYFPGMTYQGIELDGTLLNFTNSGSELLLGYSNKEILFEKATWYDFIHPEDLQAVIQEATLAIENRRPLSIEYRVLTKAQDIKYVWDIRNFNLENYSEQNKEISFDGFLLDISERKQTEEALKESRSFSDAVLDTAVEAIITINSKGIVESFNQAATRIFGYESSEVIGQNVKMLMPQPFQTEHDGYLNNYMTTGKAKIIGIGREVIGLKKNATEFPLFLSVSEVHHLTERKFVGLIRDLTEQRQAEIEAGEARNQLAHMDRLNMLSEMATGIAHEINQPLTAISMYAQTAIRLLKADNPKPDRLETVLTKMSAQAQRAGEVIERMQAMVRQEDSQRSDIECNELIQGIHKLAEVEAQMRDIEIKFKPIEEACFIFSDTVQIQQVALNLLRNGMQAMEGIECKNGNVITMTIEIVKDEVKFSVIDQGIGISPDIEKILFEPFSSSKQQGLGIGLSLCRSIISAHGGQLGYSNNSSGGATFYFTLPLSNYESNE